MANGKPILVVEGELDALLASQEVGDLVSVMTMGSASDRLTVKVSTSLTTARKVLLAFDADEAGDCATKRWAGFLPRALRLRPPQGQDLTDLHAAIGLRRLLQEQLRKHGKGVK